MRGEGSRVLVSSTAAILFLPLTMTATTAAWNDREWASGAVGSGEMLCGTTSGFDTTADGRFLSGDLLGTDIDPIADLEQMTLALGSGGVTVSPADAIDLGSTPPTEYVYANPFNLSLLGIIGVDLTGFAVPLPGAALGAANQYANVDTFGYAAGASGLVNNSGAVLVSDSTPPANLPAPATIEISDLLPTVTGFADADLRVGAVASSSVLDGCAALLDQIWGVAPAGPVSVRDYGIAGLGLQFDSPAVAGLVGTVNSSVASIQTAFDALAGSNGVISNALAARLNVAVGSILSVGMTGNVTVSGVNLATSVSSLLTTPLTDGVVTINLQTGTIDVDLDALLPSLNDAAPNTEVVLNSTVLNPIVTRAGTLLNNWLTNITTTLRGAIRGATVNVNLTAAVSAAAAVLPPSGINILSAGITGSGSVGAFVDGTATLSVNATAAGGVAPALINAALATLGLPSLTTLLATVNGLAVPLVTAVGNAITTTVLNLVTTLGTTLTSAIAPIISALGTLVAALPSVVSLMVNVQPDQSGAPPGIGFTPADADSTAEYVVAALRLGLAHPGGVAAVTLGMSSAGPVSAP